MKAASFCVLGVLSVGVACSAPIEAEMASETAALAEAPASAATITVGTEPQQTFSGFGFSFEHDNPYRELGPTQRAEVDRLLFPALGTRIIRLWYGPGNPEPIRDIYMADGIVPAALDNGVEELLLGPWSYLDDPDAQARAIAQDIVTMRDDYGVRITATGVINEPGSEPDEPAYLAAEHYVPLAIAMRAALDEAGLGDVTAIGPEFASADDVAVRWFDAVAADPRALAATDALATHSYNMAATRELATRVLAHGKQYWMTEAGGGVVDGSAEFDYVFGASAASRFLNDLNNAVTHWVWFVGLGEGTEDVYQKLVMCEGSCDQGGRIYKNWAYHLVQQISSAFVPGTVMRHAVSDVPGFEDMVWTFGAKPPVHAAAGVRPDGRWVLAAVNDTRGGGNDYASWPEPTRYTIAFEVPELAGVPELIFEVCRTGPGTALACGETLALEHGRATIELAPLELVTLLASEAAPS